RHRRFSFHRPSASPYPHSFPTRRSSDLVAVEHAGGDRAVGELRGPPLLAAGRVVGGQPVGPVEEHLRGVADGADDGRDPVDVARDRKSTRLNSSHVAISYAVFCLKKKNK